MPSLTHLALEYALLFSIGSSIVLSRFSPEELPLPIAAAASSQLHTLISRSVLALVGALLLAHHWRKELLPAYVAVVLHVASQSPQLLGASTSFSFSDSTTAWLESIALGGAMFGAILAVVFPLPDLSVLHGKYKTIGCRTARYGGVECRVFYPSSTLVCSVPATQRVPYLHHGRHLAKGIQQFSGVPAWFFNNLQNAYLAAVEGAPVAQPERKEGWPLVIYSHGLAGSLELYSYINQQLASAGNVVVVVNHGDGSASVTRPEDHRIEYYQQITDAVRKNIDGEGFRFRNQQLRHRVQEVRRVLNTITDFNKKETHEDPLWSNVDLQRVHAAGHSFGAATALTVTHVDDRFGAAVLLDVWMEPVDKDAVQGLGDRTPVLHLASDPFSVWKENADRVKQHARGCTHAQSRMKRIAGTRHNNFSDLPLFSPLINRIAKSAGSIDATYALRMVADLSAAFVVGEYDETVKKYPEVVDMHE